MKKNLVLMLMLSSVSFTSAFAAECHPEVDETHHNYMIGYGSLMDDETRKLTTSSATDVYPIIVNNFKRTWGISGGNYKTTYLLSVPAKGYKLNAVYYPISGQDVKTTDDWEPGYCRYRVPETDIKAVGLEKLPEGAYWIYAKQPEDIQKPTKDHPISQSYVDIFLRGCLQVENRYQIKGFAKQCVDTTYLWDQNAWVNDRLYPRTIQVTKDGAVAEKIDTLLSEKFDYYFNLPF